MNTQYFKNKWPGFELKDKNGNIISYDDIKVFYNLTASHGDAENNIYDDKGQPYPLGELVNAQKRSTEKDDPGYNPMTGTTIVTVSNNCKFVPQEIESLKKVMQKAGVAELA